MMLSHFQSVSQHVHTGEATTLPAGPDQQLQFLRELRVWQVRHFLRSAHQDHLHVRPGR